MKTRSEQIDDLNKAGQALYATLKSKSFVYVSFYTDTGCPSGINGYIDFTKGLMFNFEDLTGVENYTDFLRPRVKQATTELIEELQDLKEKL